MIPLVGLVPASDYTRSLQLVHATVLSRKLQLDLHNDIVLFQNHSELLSRDTHALAIDGRLGEILDRTIKGTVTRLF